MSLFRHKDSTTHPSENVVPPAPVPVEVTEEVKPAPPTVTSEPAGTPERFDRLFEEWMLSPFAAWSTEVVTIDRDDTAGELVVRATLPGLDPVKDVELTVSNGVLWIDGSHEEEYRTEEGGRVREEVRYGSFNRSIPLPDGVTAKDIDARSKDGMLEIRIPAPARIDAEKVPVKPS